MTDIVEFETLRGITEDLDGEREDVQLWRATFGDLEATATTRADCLRVLARKIDQRTGGYDLDPPVVRVDDFVDESDDPRDVGRELSRSLRENGFDVDRRSGARVTDSDNVDDGCSR